MKLDNPMFLADLTERPQGNTFYNYLIVEFKLSLESYRKLN